MRKKREKNKPIDIDRLRDLLDYDSTTGRFTWRISRGTAKVGDEAGGIDKKGYRRIKFDNVQFLGHRLAWVIYYGEDPGELQIDHIDRNPSNNSISNLRLASHSQNQRNINIYSGNISGVIGVYFHKIKKKWVSQIKINGENIYLGTFINKQDAINARISAEDRYFTDGFIPDNPGRIEI
jgi:hypothetical protein